MHGFLARLARSAASLGGRFRDDNAGNVAIVFSLLAVVMMLAVGAAVDMGRWLHARDQTMAAIDAAVLAGGQTLLVSRGTEALAIDVAKRYYNENVTSRLAVVDDTVVFKVVDGGVAAVGNAYIKTPFLQFASIAKLPLITAARVDGGDIATSGSGPGGDLEVSVMLDITGSMCDSNMSCKSGKKLDAMKAAATDLAGIIMRHNNSKYSAKMAIVPFSDSVRLPASTFNAATGNAAKIFKKTSGSAQNMFNRTENCVVERTGTNRYTDVGPGNNNYVLALRSQVASISTSDGTVLIDNNQNTVKGAKATVQWKSGSKLSTTQKNNLVSDANKFATCTVPAAAELLPLTDNETALTNKIKNLEANGTTAGQVGTAWAWYTLSPSWSSLWSSASRPAAYGTEKLRKIAVLMTDGEYNTAYDGDGIAVGMNSAGANGTSAAQAKSLCQAMKAKGIIVYTILFALNNNQTAIDTMRSCASDTKMFYNASNETQLQQAFRDIGLKEMALYLSK